MGRPSIGLSLGDSCWLFCFRKGRSKDATDHEARRGCCCYCGAWTSHMHPFFQAGCPGPRFGPRPTPGATAKGSNPRLSGRKTSEQTHVMHRFHFSPAANCNLLPALIGIFSHRMKRVSSRGCLPRNCPWGQADCRREDTLYIGTHLQYHGM